MENRKGLSAEEIKALISEHLIDMGVDTGQIEVEVVNDSEVVLRGFVGSSSEKHMIKVMITDDIGVDTVIDDEVDVMDGVGSGLEYDELVEQGGLLNQDEDEEDTEDAFQSLEEGIPYIPPMAPADREYSDIDRKNKRKKR